MKDIRVKLQSKENPLKFKYHTTFNENVKINDTIVFKWNKEFKVIKILNIKPKKESEG